MKAAFVVQPFDRLVPGKQSSSLAILTFELARHLAPYCRVTVYAGADVRGKSELQHQGVHYRYLPVWQDHGLLWRINRLPVFRNPKRPLFGSVLYYIAYVWQIAWSLRSLQADIVHIHTFPNFVPIIRALNPKIKIVLHMNDHTLTQRDPALTERRLRKVDLIIASSNYLTKNIQKCFPHLAGRCHTIYNGVDVVRFSGDNLQKKDQSKSSKRLLFVGRNSPEKGLHILLDAFKQILVHYPNSELDVVGSQTVMSKLFIDPLDEDPFLIDVAKFFSTATTIPGGSGGESEEGKTSDNSYSAFLKNKLLSGLARNVNFAGVVPHAEMVNYYRNADIFVIPSLWNEPFGIPLIEAMAAGVPTVATRGGAFTEIVHDGKTGLLVEKGNANELAEAILRLLSDKKLSQSIGEAGQRRVLECFSWERVSKKLLDHYERIMNSHPA